MSSRKKNRGIQIRNRAGFFLAEAMVAIGVLSIVSLTAIYLSSSIERKDASDDWQALLAQKRVEIVQALNSDLAWSTTVANNPLMTCMTNVNGCGGNLGPNKMNLYDATGAVLFSSGDQNSSAGHGFDLSGNNCSPTGTAACPVQLDLMWKAACLPTDTKCNQPLVTIMGLFSIPVRSQFPGAVLNLSRFDINVDRQSILWTPCPPGQIQGLSQTCKPPKLIVCDSQKWECVSATSKTCNGKATWIDAVTKQGPCFAFAGPILHNTPTGLVSNNNASNPAFIGSASFDCLPGQGVPQGFTNGFIPLNNPAAVCKPAPVDAKCGLANGKNYPSLALLIAAGPACQLGTLQNPVQLNGAIFNWECLGQNSGTNAPCVANLSSDGACGNANNQTFNTAADAMIAGLCLAGTANPSSIAGPGPWGWKCAGQNGGASPLCSAKSKQTVCEVSKFQSGQRDCSGKVLWHGDLGFGDCANKCGAVGATCCMHHAYSHDQNTCVAKAGVPQFSGGCDGCGSMPCK